MRERILPLIAVVLAGAASLATSGPGPAWTLDQSATGPAVLLTGTGGTVTQHVTVTVAAEAVDQGLLDDLVEVDALGCAENAGGATLSLRATVIPDGASADGALSQRVMFDCPSTNAVQATLFDSLLSCTSGQACTRGYTVSFDRIDPQGVPAALDVTWSASVHVEGSQGTQPPGSDVTVTIP
jgi:hypothetical protein